LLVAANLIRSWFKGAPAGNDPWGGATLEWSTTSPPPDYNYAVIPKVSSAYPMWDLEDRAEDASKVERGELALEDGHLTPATSVFDADLDEVLDMPAESIWPFVTGAATLLLFFMLLGGHLFAMAVAAGLVLLTLAGWHETEPQEG
jgi:cytochrome c oxidase subunit 1/cytochrome c oxidase subunit I+III